MHDDDPRNDTQIVDMSDSLDVDASESLVGRTLAGKYKILRKLARGGMGVVYVAEHVSLGREVVFKVLSYHLSGDSKAKSRFEREARGLSVLDHPNVVTVHDFGHEDALTYIVMEYVPGENLSQRLRRKGRIPFDELLPIVVQTVDALAAAHEKGIVHRDVKPSNVMITQKAGRNDYVKVLDFGLAKLASSSVDITKGNLVGTVSYLAPEVIKGNDASPASDVYSLGVMFYYLLSGAKPFAASDDMSVLYQHVNTLPDPLHEIVPEGEAPTQFLEFIHQCMEKDPAHRPKDASAMREMMGDAVSLPSISAFSIDSANAIPRYRPPDSSAESISRSRPVRETIPPVSGPRSSLDEPSFANRSKLSIERIRKRNRRRVAVIAFATAAVGLVVILAATSSRKEARESNPPAPVALGAAPPATVAEPAIVELVTSPSGDVYVDGEPFGRTPAAIELEPGTHLVAVTAPDHREWSEEIELAAGERRRVDVYLTKTNEPDAPTRAVAAPVDAKPDDDRTQAPAQRDEPRAPASPDEPAQPAVADPDGPDGPPTVSDADAEVPRLPTKSPSRKSGGLLSVEEKRGGLLTVD